MLVVAGCERVLQLDDIKPPHDALGGGDAKILRPCPTDGSAPTFTGTPRLIVTGCTTYTVGGPAWAAIGNGNLATADCNGTVMEGLEGGPLGDAAMGLSGTNPHQFGVDKMFMVSVANVSGYQRASTADLWTTTGAENFASLQASDVVGSPSTIGQRRDIVVSSSSGLIEYAEVTPHQWIDNWSWLTNVTPSGPANLSSDGLRLVFAATAGGNFAVYYLARADTSQMFGVAPTIVFQGPNRIVTPFMTDDCQTLYYSDFASDVYAVDP